MSLTDTSKEQVRLYQEFKPYARPGSGLYLPAADAVRCVRRCQELNLVVIGMDGFTYKPPYLYAREDLLMDCGEVPPFSWVPYRDGCNRLCLDYIQSQEWTEGLLFDLVIESQAEWAARKPGEIWTSEEIDAVSRIRVENQETRDRFALLVADVVDGPEKLRMDWVRGHNWAAVPVPGSIDYRQAEWITVAAQSLGYSHLYTMSDGPGGLRTCDRIFLAPGNFLWLEYHRSPWAYVSAPEDLGFAILNPFGDFHVVAGPASFVRAAAGCSLSTAREYFLNYYRDDLKFPKGSGQRFIDITRDYDSCDGGLGTQIPATPGSEFSAAEAPSLTTIEELDVITPVENKATVEGLLSSLDELLESPTRASAGWLRAHGWAAMPLLSRLSLMQAEWIVEAARSQGCHECFAVSTTSTRESFAYRVPMTRDAVAMLYEKSAFLENFVLAPSDLSFAIVGESRHYYVVTGPLDFVSTAIGSSFDAATMLFLAWDAYSQRLTSEVVREREAIMAYYEPFTLSI